MSLVIIVLLALILFALVVLPLLVPSYRDPLPDTRDPVLLDLEEEREALFRAIRELDAREDLSAERREALRQRYEAKAAKVLRRLDEVQAHRPAPPPPPQRALRYWPLVALLGVTVISAAMLGNFVLPRIGQDATVTTADPTLLALGRELQQLERAARDNPGASTLLALGDAYWRLGELEQAARTYERLIAEVSPVPAIAYRRLGFLMLHTDIAEAVPYLTEAVRLDPNDADSLFALAEIHFALGDVDAAIGYWQAFLATPGGRGDAEVAARLAMVSELAPLLKEAQREPGEASFLALADALWERDERDQAADVYFQVLTGFNPNSPQALSRLGVALFFSGDNDSAMLLLERARTLRPDDLETLLFLGNAYYSAERFDAAIEAWQDYVEAAGGPEYAGRVPSLMASAQERQRGLTPPGEAGAAALFAANCASCHGALGQGGMTLSGGVQVPVPPLTDNPNAADFESVRALLLAGRGAMPSFAHLGDDKLTELARYVTQTLYPGEASRP